MQENDEKRLNLQMLQQMNNEVNEQLVKLLIDQREILIFIENDLRGYVLDLQSGEYKPLARPKVNEEGIREIINLLMIHLSGNVTLSTLTDEQIEIICKNLHKELAYMLGSQYQKFGIEPSDRQMILTKIMNSIFLSTKRATGGLTINSITKTTRESYIQGNENKRTGVLGGLFKNG